MFGKRLSEYVAFQKVPLAILAAVGLLKLGLSIAGVPDATMKFLPMNVVVLVATIWYGVAVYKTGFGSYKQLLPLVLIQAAVFHGIAILGILLAIAGMANIYAAPEFSGPAPANQWLHLAAHATIGMVAVTLIGWGVSSLAMLVAKKTSPRTVLA